MAFRLSALWNRTPATRSTPKPRVNYFRPVLEGFEDRVVPAAPVLGAAQAARPRR